MVGAQTEMVTVDAQNVGAERAERVDQLMHGLAQGGARLFTIAAAPDHHRERLAEHGARGVESKHREHRARLASPYHDRFAGSGPEIELAHQAKPQLGLTGDRRHRGIDLAHRPAPTPTLDIQKLI